jgi:hypothetical protein
VGGPLVHCTDWPGNTVERIHGCERSIVIYLKDLPVAVQNWLPCSQAASESIVPNDE